MVTLDPKLTDCIEVLFSNALAPIVVTLLGIEIEVKDVFPLNADGPIVVKPVPKVAVSKEVLFKNAFSPIEVTELGILMDLREVLFSNACSRISFRLDPSVTDFRFALSANARHPIEVTLLPTVTVSSVEIFEKEFESTFTTLLGILTVFRDVKLKA